MSSSALHIPSYGTALLPRVNRLQLSTNPCKDSPPSSGINPVWWHSFLLQLFWLLARESTHLHFTGCSPSEVLPGPGPGGLIMPATIYRKPGAFLPLTLPCIEVVCIIAAGAVLYLLLRRDRPPDTRIECSIRLKSMR